MVKPFFAVFISQYATRISLGKKLKDQSGALHSPFMFFYTIKAPDGKLTVFRRFFSASIDHHNILPFRAVALIPSMQ